MIKINLLPYVEKKKEADLKRQIIVMSSLFVVFLLIISSLHIYFTRSIGNLEKEIKEGEAQLRILTKIVGNIDEFKKDKEILNKKLKIINTLDKSRLDPVLFLDDLTIRVPHKNVWLTALSQSETALRMEGIASDNTAIAKFMKNLEGSRHIESVDLVSSKHVIISGIKLKKFALSCTMRKG